MIVPLPAGATLRPLELPARADAGPTPLIRAYADVRNTSLHETTGRTDAFRTAESLLPMLRSTPEQRRRQWYVEQDGEIVGCCATTILLDDGGDTGMIGIALLRRVWDQGIGGAVLAHVEAELRAAGVRRLLNWTEHAETAGADVDRLPSPTGYGSVPHDHAARFLLRHGYRLEQVERISRFIWTGDSVAHLQRLLDEARSHAPGYGIVQWMLPTPPARLDGYALLKSRMSTDVPDADLDMPAEAWDADRVRRHDDLYAVRGSSVLVTAAEEVATGRLCAFNELAITADHTTATQQEDTLVLAEHRSRRLGMLVKTAGLLTWRERFPESPYVITANAEENRPMLSINEAIGFTPIAYEGAWKKELT
ncbi:MULTISPECIES: GNAT family N-acetyltransferase [Microbacterium]|uniref:GNAT family N-acetyltransferase n=1 Tax=Microbacterium TaxID=33882 RepID=UPI00217F186F|nr:MULTISPECIES: GNAT family N-acetyltransferase [Microbacterium]UWF78452.1 GNAT family N-acetyltransferase [Microbacterium neungamense]WCM56628.1 GNAT family N-acetyltransferase [Microbacterium sp. EF45047]